MSVPFSAVVTPDSLVFSSPDGKTHSLSSDHSAFAVIKQMIKEIQQMRLDDEFPNVIEACINEMVALINPSKRINDQGDDLVTVHDGVVYYRNKPVRSVIAERILWGLDEGFDMNPYLRFLENLMENPSHRSVEQLYTFIERNKMGITEDGHVLAYKRVRDDFMDIYSGTFDNSPGQIVEERRNLIDDNPQATCSKGLHACAMTYLPHYGCGCGPKIVVVKINPRDVVSVPVDYDAAKMRICRYEVLSEYTGNDKEDLLGQSPVFDTDEFLDDDSGDEDDIWKDDLVDDTSELDDHVCCGGCDNCDCGNDTNVVGEVENPFSIGDRVIRTEYLEDPVFIDNDDIYTVMGIIDEDYIFLDGLKIRQYANDYTLIEPHVELDVKPNVSDEVNDQIKIGDKVVLKAGGTVYTVTNIDDDYIFLGELSIWQYADDYMLHVEPNAPDFLQTGVTTFQVDQSLTWDVSRLPQ